MSVLIKDMEMPTSCTMCWLNTFCGVWNIEPVKYKGFNKRLDDCPLSELIKCKDCRYFRPDDNCDQCALWDYGDTDREAFCSYAMRRGEEDAKH